MKARVEYDGSIVSSIFKSKPDIEEEEKREIVSENEPSLPIADSKTIESLRDFIRGGNLVVFSDSDADGICAASIASVSIPRKKKVIIANPQDGHSVPAGLAAENAGSNILVLDCGTNERALFEEVGGTANFFVLDHHEPQDGEVSENISGIINPKINDPGFTGYSGSGVTMKAIEDVYGPMSYATQFAMVGTIGDVMPMRRENRRIVREGLHLLKTDPANGLSHLIRRAGKDPASVNETDIAFYVVPMINAARRVGSARSAYTAVVSEGDVDGKKASEILWGDNERRKTVVNEKVESAVRSNNVVEHDRVVVCLLTFIEESMSGLFAARIQSDYRKPAIVVARNGGKNSGSIRCPSEYKAHEFLSSVSNLLNSGGGHDGAAGFSIKEGKVAEFVKRAVRYFSREITGDEFDADIQIDIEDAARGIDAVDSLRPYGKEFEAPLFMSKVKARDIKVIGKDKSHLSFWGDTVKCLAFNQAYKIGSMPDNIEICYTIERDSFAGRNSVVAFVRKIGMA